MRRFRTYDIVYDTDGHKINGLPRCIDFDVDDPDFDPAYGLADKISDKTGWLVLSFQFAEVPKDARPRRFNIMTNVGKAKHVVNYHDGLKRHSDGSDFFDIAIFGNRKDRDRFVRELRGEGYVDENDEAMRT